MLTRPATDPQAFGFQDLPALQIQGAEALGARSVQPDLYDQPAPFNVNFPQAGQAQPAAAHESGRTLQNK